MVSAFIVFVVQMKLALTVTNFTIQIFINLIPIEVINEKNKRGGLQFLVSKIFKLKKQNDHN